MTRLISWFCHTHGTSRGSQHILQPRHHWLSLVGASHAPHPALKTALVAVALVRWSKVERNPGLLQQARSQYSRSLTLMRRALTSHQDAIQDDTLATACVMVFYELTDSTSLSLNTWLEHVMGVGNLLRLRGPAAFSNPASRAVFEQMRQVFMLHHLMNRTSSVFGEPAWLHSPWQGAEKAVEQQIFDQGLRLTSLLKVCDALSMTGYTWTDLDAPLCTCVNICKNLDELDVHLHRGRTPTSEGSHVPIGIEDLDPEALLLHITVLGIRLGTAEVVHNLLFLRRSEPVAQSSSINSGFEVSISILGLCDSRRSLAHQILECVQVRSQTHTRALSTIRMIWALDLASRQFSRDEPIFEQCQAVLTQLSANTAPFDALKPGSMSIT